VQLRAPILAAILATIVIVGFGAIPASAKPPQRFIALCYHNVEDSDPDQTFVSVTTSKFIAQLSWFQREGYQFLSVDDLLAAKDGRKPLPDKGVLLTFDDGYESFYTRVFPILKAFHAHAVLGLVGAWMGRKPGETIEHGESENDATVQYGGHAVPRDWFMTWEQVREVVASGLVEIASHSYDLHHGVLANPQDNLEPSAVTRIYDRQTGYQSEKAYLRRINHDTARMARTIERETGRKVRVMIWPYGEYNRLAISIQAAHGMPLTFTLRDGSASIAALSAIPRDLVSLDPSLAAFVTDIRQIDEVSPVRAVQVDLDYVYDPDPAQQERNLGVLVQRIHDLDISTVYLQAFADPDGTGLARQVYFPNSQLPMRADLFNRAAWQLRTRAHVRVYAWMPVLAIDFGSSTLQHVTAWQDPHSRENSTAEAGNIPRLSPFDPVARRRIRRLYEELAQHAPIAGILFGDDAVLSDYEDASPAALDAYGRAGLPRSIAAIRADPKLFERWTNLKTEALIQFTQELAQVVREYRSPLRTARNIFARPLLDPTSAARFAQQYDRFLAAYDYVAVMAMPRLEEVPEANTSNWLKCLVAVAAARPNGLRKTVFELQSVDWRKQSLGTDRDIPSKTLAGEMDLLERLGALNLAYYPDDFLHDQPRAAITHPAFSLQSHPYKLR
jgi:poly-beta-1,6-N-acetyl-D-glucosamine N-deacetylase